MSLDRAVKKKITPCGEDDGHNQCPTCSKEFHFLSGFDRHRAGSFNYKTRRCLTTLEMENAGMKLGKLSRWHSSHSGDSNWVQSKQA
jgi:hypothetical protein